MKLQILKIFSFWAIFALMVNVVIEAVQSNPSTVSNIQLTKPPVVKVKPGKNLHFGSAALSKNKRIAMK